MNIKKETSKAEKDLIGELVELRQQYALLFLEGKSRKALRSKIRKIVIKLSGLRVSTVVKSKGHLEQTLV